MISEARSGARSNEIRAAGRGLGSASDLFRNHHRARARSFSRTRTREIVVLETGLGGRLDATNATQPVVSVLTPIDYDHQKWLGDTLTEIAGEKAGIIKPHIPVVSAGQEPDAAQVICARALECEAPLEIVSQPYTKTPVALAGAHQKQNAAVAIAGLRVGGIQVDNDAIARGLASGAMACAFSILEQPHRHRWRA